MRLSAAEALAQLGEAGKRKRKPPLPPSPPPPAADGSRSAGWGVGGGGVQVSEGFAAMRVKVFAGRVYACKREEFMTICVFHGISIRDPQYVFPKNPFLSMQ